MQCLLSTPWLLTKKLAHHPVQNIQLHSVATFLLLHDFYSALVGKGSRSAPCAFSVVKISIFVPYRLAYLYSQLYVRLVLQIPKDVHVFPQAGVADLGKDGSSVDDHVDSAVSRNGQDKVILSFIGHVQGFHVFLIFILVTGCPMMA